MMTFNRMALKEPLKEKIIGSWKLVSWTYQDVNGQTVDFFGPDPTGILMYDQSGYMNAQLMRSDGRRLFTSGTLISGSKEEIEQAYKSYAAYFGRYEERSPGELTHMVEGSLQPNWVGQEEIRYARIENEYLILTAPPVRLDETEVCFTVRWKRIL